MQRLTSWAIGVLLTVSGTTAAPPAPSRFSPAGIGYTVTSWTVEDGLPIQNITALAQSRDGFLWCGTSDGLARFDGIEFKVYLPHEVAELDGFQIAGLVADSQGRLWIIDAAGQLAVFEAGQFRRLGPADKLPEGGTAELREDATGGIWLRGKNNGKFYKLSANGFEPENATSCGENLREFCVHTNGLDWAIRGDGSLLRFTQGDAEDHRLPGANNSSGLAGSFFALEDGTRALTSALGIFTWETNGWNLRHQFHAPLSGEPRNGCRDREGNFWIGTAGSGLVLSLKDGRTARVELPGESYGASIHCLIRGRDGNIWVGSSAGLYRLSRNSIRPGFDATQEAVKSVAVGNQQLLWFIQEGHLYWAAPQTNVIHKVAIDDQASALASRLAPAHGGGVWVGIGPDENLRCAVWWASPTAQRHIGFVAAKSIADLRETSAGELLLATPDGLFRRESEAFTKVELPGAPARSGVTSLAEDASGKVYAAVTGVGLFGREGGVWRRLTKRADASSDRIQAMTFDAQGVLWMAADRPGLAQWRQNRWFAFSGLDLELPRKARALAADEQDGLWMSSRWGLVRVSRAELNHLADGNEQEINSTWFDRDDGLLSIDCAPSPSGVCCGPSGNIWVGTAAGLCVIDPAEWSQQRLSRRPPSVAVEQVSVDGAVLPESPPVVDADGKLRRKFVVPPGSQRVDIRFTGVDLTAPEKMRFRYRLEGFDKQWLNAPTPRAVHFGRLPPGQYRFQLMAVNNVGVWNREAAVLRLIVLPQWWQRASVRGFAVALLLGIIWLVAQARLRRLQHERAQQTELSRQLLRSQEHERQRIARDLHDSLGQNLLVAKNLALTGVNASGQAPETSALFEEISDTVSSALHEARSLSKALRPPELDRLGLTKALRDMMQRAGEASGIACEIDLEDIDGLLPADDAINLYRLVQEAMNNIVKHSGASCVVLTLQHHPDHIFLRITDNGRGFDVAKVREATGANTGTGLAGMEERARLTGGEFSLSSEPEKGSTLAIRIPVKSPQP